MIKFIFLALAVLVFVHPSSQLKCYRCRSDEYNSAFAEANAMKVCDKPFSNEDEISLSDIDFPECKKMVETVKDKDGKTSKHIIRTWSKKNITLSPNNKDFEEYNCTTDLCNSSIMAKATVFAMALSVTAAVVFNY